MADQPAQTVVLCVLDGWGHRGDVTDNAVAQAQTPVVDRLWREGPRCYLRTCGQDVGLPDGQIGNSEVGHMNIGAGRVVWQDLLKITNAFNDGELAQNETLAAFTATLRDCGSTCHLMGLVSPGGVHAHEDHVIGLARLVADAGVPVCLHAFTDGRDTPPKSAGASIKKLEQAIAGMENVSVGTVIGRYFAMDRDKRWERVESAYQAIASGEGAKFPTPTAVVEAAYSSDTTDEFIEAAVVDGFTGMKEGDGILFANFRADRARQILSAFLDPAFDGFAANPPKLAAACGMVEYSDTHNQWMSALFPPKSLTHVLGHVVADAGRKQMRLAETEKYPHVTFFLNGGEEATFDGEDRTMVPSPKVATYDLQPEMSAPDVAKALVGGIESQQYGLIVVNFANPDMVGHTGDLKAAIRAVETVDTCLGQAVAAAEKTGAVMFVTADHGNCETMRDPDTGEPHTAHTLNVVPAMLVGVDPDEWLLADGRLADVAPTLLELADLTQPAEMTGTSLLVRKDEEQA